MPAPAVARRSCQSATNVEPWTPAAPGTRAPDGELFAEWIAPLLPFRFKAALWDQGEVSRRTDPRTHLANQGCACSVATVFVTLAWPRTPSHPIVGAGLALLRAWHDRNPPKAPCQRARGEEAAADHAAHARAQADARRTNATYYAHEFPRMIKGKQMATFGGHHCADAAMCRPGVGPLGA